jgi:hypothetical protein
MGGEYSMHITDGKRINVVVIHENIRVWKQSNIKTDLKEGLLWAAFILHKLMSMNYENSGCFVFRREISNL